MLVHVPKQYKVKDYNQMNKKCISNFPIIKMGTRLKNNNQNVKEQVYMHVIAVIGYLDIVIECLRLPFNICIMNE